MKRYFPIAIFLLLTVCSIVLSVDAWADMKSNADLIEGSSYSNECPGEDGQRQIQVVGCFSDFWGYITRTGCCYGNSSCDYNDPCGSGKSFQCGSWCNSSSTSEGTIN